MTAPPSDTTRGRTTQDLIDRLVDDWAIERPDLDTEPMGVVGRIIHLGTLLRNRAHDALGSHDLHYTDLDLLATLRRSGAPYRLTPTDLSRSVLLTSGAMTAAVRRLEKRGLVTRAPSVTDGRVRMVELTTSGRHLVDHAIHTRFEEAREAVRGLTPDERTSLADLLRRLALTLPD